MLQWLPIELISSNQPHRWVSELLLAIIIIRAHSSELVILEVIDAYVRVILIVHIIFHLLNELIHVLLHPLDWLKAVEHVLFLLIPLRRLQMARDLLVFGDLGLLEPLFVPSTPALVKVLDILHQIE